MAQSCQACIGVRCMFGIAMLCSVSFYLGSLYPVSSRSMPCLPLERFMTPADDHGGAGQHESIVSIHADGLHAVPLATPSPEHFTTPAYDHGGAIQHENVASNLVDGLPAAPRRRRQTQRHIYLDMGANWANTLRLYENIAGVSHREASYEVYAFEANPIIQTYVDKFVYYLNGKGPKPLLLIPPAGSNSHLRMYSKRYRCNLADKTAMVKCMQSKFEKQLSRLPLNESLNDRGLVASRMADASRALAGVRKTRFTLIPAAVGTKQGILEMSRHGALYGIMRGGAIQNSELLEARIKVPIVDVVSWMLKYFSETDYIVMKMDAEGAEHDIFDALLASGKLAILDVLAYECHPPSSDKCKVLNRRVDAAAKSAGTLVLREGRGRFAYEGVDQYSTPDKYFPLDP